MRGDKFVEQRHHQQRHAGAALDEWNFARDVCVTPAPTASTPGQPSTDSTTPDSSSSETPNPCTTPDGPDGSDDSPSSPAPEGGSSLAHTGANVAIALVGVAAIAGGIALLIQRRRA